MMRRIAGAALVVGALIVGCSSSGDDEAGEAVDTAATAQAESDGDSAPAADSTTADAVCATAVVDPLDFVPDEATDDTMVEFRRAPTDATWLRVEGTVGCLVELQHEGSDRRDASVEVYMFDTEVRSAADFAAFVQSFNPDRNQAVEGTDGWAIVEIDGDRTISVVTTDGDRGVFVQTSARQADDTALLAVAASAFDA